MPGLVGKCKLILFTLQRGGGESEGKSRTSLPNKVHAFPGYVRELKLLYRQYHLTSRKLLLVYKLTSRHGFESSF